MNTYKDERGYMVSEEVWVEREVERPLPMGSMRPAGAVTGAGAAGSSAGAPAKPATAKLQPSVKPAPKPAPARGAGKGKEARGMDSVDAEELAEGKPKGKGGAKGKAPAAPSKPASGKASIMGFFGKK